MMPVTTPPNAMVCDTGDMMALLTAGRLPATTHRVVNPPGGRDGGRYSIARAGWIADYNDPQNFLFLLEPDNTAFNYAHWVNMEFDGLMTQAAATVDLEARAAILAQAEAIAMAEEPFLVLLHYGSKNLVSPRLHGWEDNPQDFHATRWMTLDP